MASLLLLIIVISFVVGQFVVFSGQGLKGIVAIAVVEIILVFTAGRIFWTLYEPTLSDEGPAHSEWVAFTLIWQFAPLCIIVFFMLTFFTIRLWRKLNA